MKYVKGLHKSIPKKLKFFKVEDISKASMKTIGIEEKNLPRQSKTGDMFKKGGRKHSQKGKHRK